MPRTYTTQVNMRWGRDSRREVEVPVVHRRHNDRWYVKTVDGETLGWITGRERSWTAYARRSLKGHADDFLGYVVAESRSRDEATQALVDEHAFHTACSPLYELFLAAYDA